MKWKGAYGTASVLDATAICPLPARSPPSPPRTHFSTHPLCAPPSPGKTADGKAVNGKITVPNLSEENEIDEVDVRLSAPREKSLACPPCRPPGPHCVLKRQSADPPTRRASSLSD